MYVCMYPGNIVCNNIGCIVRVGWLALVAACVHRLVQLAVIVSSSVGDRLVIVGSSFGVYGLWVGHRKFIVWSSFGLKYSHGHA
jgi:hypothetical protein